MNIYTKFKNPADFRKSLEARLQVHAAKTGTDLQRLRRKVAFDRFLARIFPQEGSGFFLKGGYAMELRIAQARATKDIDLTYIRRVKNNSELMNMLLLTDLRALANKDLDDHFVYQIGQTQMDLENAPYGGSRYPVTTLIDGRIYIRFQLDVGADHLLDQTENVQGGNWLEFCGISAPVIKMISIAQQFAEKMHAYTLPRTERVNSRVKDLVDMVLLLNIREPKLDEMMNALEKVFSRRATHSLPPQLDSPPIEWASKFSAMASECGISSNIHLAFEKVDRFYARLTAQVSS